MEREVMRGKFEFKQGFLFTYTSLNSTFFGHSVEQLPFSCFFGVFCPVTVMARSSSCLSTIHPSPVKRCGPHSKQWRQSTAVVGATLASFWRLLGQIIGWRAPMEAMNVHR